MNIQSPAAMAALRGVALALLLGIAAFLTEWQADDPETINNAIQTGLIAAVGVLVARVGEGAYDQLRASRGAVSTADVPVAAVREGKASLGTVRAAASD